MEPQPNHHNLSQSESIYFGHMATPALTIVKASKTTTEAVIKPIYRRAGRKKLTPEQIITRDQYQAGCCERVQEERAKERQRKAEIKAEGLRKKQERIADRLSKKLHIEQLQAMRNKQQVHCEPVVANMNVLPSFVTGPATGAPPMDGHIAVKIISSKRVIYVKNGNDIPQAVAAYKNKHGLI